MKYIKIIFFLFLKYIFNINTSKKLKNIKKINLKFKKKSFFLNTNKRCLQSIIIPIEGMKFTSWKYKK